MGNNSTREARGPDSPSANALRQTESGGTVPASPGERPAAAVYSSARTGRGSRHDLSFLGIGASSQNETPERRETKQEREARKLEKERVARIKEREKSLKEEHVDGGYLVTMGVYTGLEDFNKAVVRQLMIERRLAPFWRGLDDFNDGWTEYQLVAAGRGLPIPPADEIPPQDSNRSLSPDSAHPSHQNLQNLMPPISSRSQSAASDASATLSPSHPAFSNGSSSGPTSPALTLPSSPFRPRSKTLASFTSKTLGSSESTPREIQLQKDPYVNGQAIEVYLYKDSSECPICFMYYPPYLNKTRCCDQSICSECFVQIKRPDPHHPEHQDPSNPAPPPSDANLDPEALVSEAACCPYCQQSDFGVIYMPPPFRRGLSYANANHGLGNVSSAMSSSTSINSTGAFPTSPVVHKRRTTSISANASTVITTDKVRPDWATKLQNARNHLARRSAAATALHTAAYLMGNGTQEQRNFGFSGRSRFGRNRTNENSPGASGSATPAQYSNEPTPRSVSDQLHLMRREVQETGGTRNRSRMEDLEDMMMMEAIRQSLAAEDDRKKKQEKDAAKDAKKRAKEDKKKEKKEKKGVYGSGASSASGSALSLSLPGMGFGRRRGNSGASNLQREIIPDEAEGQESKGKGIDRSDTGLSGVSSGSGPIDFFRSGSSGQGIPGARHLDTNTLTAINDSHQPSPSPTAPEKPSHLRQMSNASSPASSFMESNAGSIRNPHGSSSTLNSPNASGTNIAAGGDAGSESLFNFRSLAARIGEAGEKDREDAAKHIEYLDGGSSTGNDHGEHSGATLEESVATLKVKDSRANTTSDGTNETRPATLQKSQRTTPEVMITPETPGVNHGDDDGKQLGAHWADASAREITQ